MPVWRGGHVGKEMDEWTLASPLDVPWMSAFGPFALVLRYDCAPAANDSEHSVPGTEAVAA